MRTLKAYLLVVTCFLVTPAHSSNTVGDFFTSMGTVTTTQPGVFKGQTMNHFVGGGFSYRVPQKTYQLASMSAPNLTVGACGDIDAFAGAFSFINSDQLVQMLQNIGNNAVGAIFKIAIDTISPELGGVMDYMNDLAQKVNSLNVNSCQAATGIVTAAADMAREKKGIEDTSLYQTGKNIFDDMMNAKDIISSNISERRAAREAMNTDPDTKDKFADVNITWESFNNTRVGGSELNNQERRMLMTMFGTVLCSSDDTDGSGEDDSPRVCMYHPPAAKLKIKELVLGDGTSQLALMGAGCSYNASAGTASRECMYPQFNQTTPFSFTVYGQSYKSFHDYVSQEMEYLKDAIATRNSGSLDQARLQRTYGLIQLSSLPAWTIVKIAASDALGKAMYEEMKESLAHEIAYNWLLERASVIKMGLMQELSNSEYFSTEDDALQLQKQVEDLDEVTKSMAEARRTQFDKLASLGASLQTTKAISDSFNYRMAEQLRR